jgi:H+-transporting ATPase
MITGDYFNIAKELARQVDLGGNIYANTSLWPASAARDDLITNADGFAQVMPKDKYEVVAVLQGQGKVVGMTGDGVNDAPALAKAQIGIAVAGATDAAQAASDIVLTKEGLSPIFTAIVQSRKIFKRLKAYVIYRICVTVQVVVFLCIVSFVYNEAFQALYIILLALFHDLTIVTIAYDHQEASQTPEHPTVVMLIVVAYACGLTLAASSSVLYAFGDMFLSSKFNNADPISFKYKESCMFLQVSNSSAFLIFCARTSGFFFASVPALELFLSAVVSQLVVNSFLLFSGGFIVEQLDPMDIALIWAYDISWLLIIDMVKMGINHLQGGEKKAMEAFSRQSFAGGVRASRASKSSRPRSGAPSISKDVRISVTGAPMTPRGGELSGPVTGAPGKEYLW